MTKALHIRDLYLRHGGQQIFSELSLEAERGEIIAVCGTEGSHKSYFVNLLTRSYSAPYTLTGELFVDGAEIEKLSDEDLRFARMMNIAILPDTCDAEALDMTVLKYITLPYREKVKKTVHEIITDTKRIMQLLGVANPERVFNTRMSALHIKDLRAALYAVALATDPAVAIAFADAPDMSPNEADELYTLLIKVCKIKNITLLFLTADIHFATRHGEKTFIMENDRLYSLDDASSHPHLQFLTAATEMRTLFLPAPGDEALLSALHAVPMRGMQSLAFTLHKGEILGVACSEGAAYFAGNRRLISGSIQYKNVPIQKKKDYIQNIFSVHADMPLLPVHSAEESILAYTARPSQRKNLSQIYTSVGLSSDYGKTPTPPKSLFEVLRLGLVCAAVCTPEIIFLSDIDFLPSAADRYEILTLLAAVCEQTGAAALVFSDNTAVLHALGTKFYTEDTNADQPEFADAENDASFQPDEPKETSEVTENDTPNAFSL